MGGGVMTGEENSLQAPFPWFGGKRRAAPIVWRALGDPAGYVEPFAGSAAVLLARPAFTGRRVETINDADGWLVNVWRAIQLDPERVAVHAVGPVSEIDYHARLAWLQERRGDDLVSWLEGDPEAHDAKVAGWWLTVVAAGIGDPFGSGPWRVVDGRLTDTRELPHLGNAGGGVNRKLPSLGNAGRGVNRELPSLGDAGRGDALLVAYLRVLAQRLARVRITCGDWSRVVTDAVARAGTGGDGSRAVFLDPPYATSGDLYAVGATGVAGEAACWAHEHETTYRIVLAGYDDEHDWLCGHGWRKERGKAGSGSGYSTRADNGRRERLWLSPSCLGDDRFTAAGIAVGAV